MTWFISSNVKYAYMRARAIYAKRLFLSNTISTMLLNGVGDIMCQMVERKLEQIEHKKIRYAHVDDMKDKTKPPTFWDKYDWQRSGN